MTRFEVRDIELLLSILATGSIARGAESQGLSASAGSLRVSSLERRLGVQLLDRGRRGVVPTVAGERFAREGALLLDGIRGLETALEVEAQGFADVVRLGVNTPAVDAMTEFLAATLNRMPRLAIDLRELRSEEVIDAVVGGSLDLGVVSYAAATEFFETRPLWDDTLVVIGAAAAHRPAQSSDNLLRAPLVGLRIGSPLQDRVDEHLRAAGGQPVYRLRLPSLAAVCAVASTGAASAVVPRGAADRYQVPTDRLYSLDEGWAIRQSMIVARSFDELTSTTADLVQALLQYAQAEV